jgi:serine/threonine protein phosphatase PrpC
MSLRKPTTQAQENRLLHVLRVGDSELIRSRLSMMNNSGNDAGNALPDYNSGLLPSGQVFHAQDVGGPLARVFGGGDGGKWSDESVTAGDLKKYFKTQATKNFNLRNAESTVTFKPFKQLTMTMNMASDNKGIISTVTVQFLDKTNGLTVPVGDATTIGCTPKIGNRYISCGRRDILNNIKTAIESIINRMKNVEMTATPAPLLYTTRDALENLEFDFDDDNKKKKNP